jgi:nitrogen fixation protein NifU and related proteins
LDMVSNNFYSKETIKHFRNPHNYGIIPNADGVGEAGNIVCGDVMSLYIKIKDDVITNVKFKTYGCAAAIATSSVITDLVKGKTIEVVLKINKDNIIRTLKTLPPIKIHCSVLAIDALGEAIYQYLKKNKRMIPKELEKRHFRIEAGKKQIKARYEGYLKLRKEEKEVSI